MPNDKIVLGSGDVYTLLFADSIPADDVIETPENKLGEVKSGATLSYKGTYYTAESDNLVRKKTIMSSEEASLKCGVITWNGKLFEKLCQTAVVTEDATEKKRTVKIGGAKRFADKKYVIRFHHKDAIDGDIRVTIVGSNEGGFELTFAKDKETIINPEFKAYPSDEDGTLIIYEESLPDETPEGGA